MLIGTATKKPFSFTAIAAVLGLWLVLISAASARAERRVAFVVGNSAYQHADYLPNPIKDAQAMAEKFKQAGFEVVSAQYDTENLQFKRAIRRFEDIATGADIAVVYYAGHGIEVNGVNYLIPVDAKLASDRDIEDETIALGRLVVTVEGAKRLRLVILDACRDNPFIKMKRERVGRTRQISSGLGAIGGTGTDTLVAYAARDGTTAEDGATQHSPFTAALLKHLFTPGLDVRLAFGRIRDAVLDSTGKRQEPYVYGSLGKETVSLVPAPVKVAVNTEELSAVKADYQLVERIGSKRAWEVFLKQYPSGFYSDLARQQIDGLAKQASTKLAALEPPKPPAPPRPSSEEQRAWDRIKDSSDENKFKHFIRRYPASVLANTARLRLDALERAAEERDAQARAEQERKAAERARLKAERERKRAEEERLARATAEAARQKAEREAKLSAEAKREAACKREEARLAALQSSGKRSLGDLRRLSDELTCDRVRPNVIAALDQATKELEAEKAVPVPTEPPEPPEPIANTPELVRSAQAELVRIGCLDGRVDGIMGNNTRGAIERYLSEQGKGEADVDITENFVAALKKESGRVCPLTCSSGEIVEGGRCVAVQKPEPAARDKDDDDKAAARARARRDEERRERAAARAREREERAAARAKAREERAARRRARQDDNRAASRRRSKKEATRSRPRPRVKQQASTSRRRYSGGGGGGAGPIGVGF